MTRPDIIGSQLNDYTDVYGYGKHTGLEETAKFVVAGLPYMQVEVRNSHPSQGAFIPQHSKVFFTTCAMNTARLNELFNFTSWDMWRNKWTQENEETQWNNFKKHIALMMDPSSKRGASGIKETQLNKRPGMATNSILRCGFFASDD